jgi:uncharacterized membrane protein YphA (DoxX/SURF4 family)
MAIKNTASREVERIDVRLIAWFRANSITALRLAIGTVFLWFGFLKYFPARSPAEDLAARTIQRITLGLLGRTPALAILATWETAIGLGLITGRFRRGVLLLLWTQMAGTFMPLVLFRRETWAKPLVPTLEGQYIFKNIVTVTGAMVVGATLRGREEVAPRPPEPR